MLDERALPGDVGRIGFGVAEGPMVDECGELVGLRSSLPPSMDEMDMPAVGLCVAKSRTPAKGDVVGGPRGADAR